MSNEAQPVIPVTTNPEPPVNLEPTAAAKIAKKNPTKFLVIISAVSIILLVLLIGLSAILLFANNQNTNNQTATSPTPTVTLIPTQNFAGMPYYFLDHDGTQIRNLSTTNYTSDGVLSNGPNSASGYSYLSYINQNKIAFVGMTSSDSAGLQQIYSYDLKTKVATKLKEFDIYHYPIPAWLNDDTYYYRDWYYDYDSSEISGYVALIKNENNKDTEIFKLGVNPPRGASYKEGGTRMQFSPDKSVLLYFDSAFEDDTYNDRIYLVNTSTNQVVKTIDRALAPNWSDNETVVYQNRDDHFIYEYNLNSQLTIQKFKVDAETYGAQYNDNRLAFWSTDEAGTTATLTVISLSDGKEQLSIVNGNEPIWIDSNTLVYEKTEVCTVELDCNVVNGRKSIGFFRYDFSTAKETKIATVNNSIVGPMQPIPRFCESIMCGD